MRRRIHAYNSAHLVYSGYTLHFLYTSEALEAKGVTTNATKKAGIWEAREKPFTASTIGSAKSPTTTAPVCVYI